MTLPPTNKKPRRVGAFLLRHKVKIKVTSAIVLTLGLLLTGFGLGQLMLPRTVVAGPVISASVSAESDRSVDAVMPGVLGLDESVARRVLSNAGIRATITFTEQPAAGDPGTVVNQVPAQGQSVGESVQLVLSSATTVPAVSGLTLNEARSILEDLGTFVSVRLVVQPAAVIGSVLSVEPAEGEPLGRLVTLHVADPGQGLSLTQLKHVDRSGFSTISRGSLSGTVIGPSVSSKVGSKTSFIEWNLGKHGAVIEGVLGILDTGDEGSATFRVIGDGVVLLEEKVTFGSSSNIRVDVRGVLRLRVEVVPGSGSPTVVLGDGRVLGSAEDLVLIQAGS